MFEATASRDGEADPEFLKSRYCTGSTCVEVRIAANRVDVRDGKQVASGDTIGVDPKQWLDFLAEIKGAEPTENGAIILNHQRDGGVTLASRHSGVVLSFDAAEWDAFEKGVVGGDFERIPAGV